MKIYLYNLLCSLDQFVNSILGGDRDTTLSARCWYHRETWAGWCAVVFLDWLFRWYEEDHCRKSYEADPEEAY